MLTTMVIVKTQLHNNKDKGSGTGGHGGDPGRGTRGTPGTG